MIEGVFGVQHKHRHMWLHIQLWHFFQIIIGAYVYVSCTVSV